MLPVFRDHDPLHEVSGCQSSPASQSVHYPRNSAYAEGRRLLYLVAEVKMG